MGNDKDIPRGSPHQPGGVAEEAAPSTGRRNSIGVTAGGRGRALSSRDAGRHHLPANFVMCREMEKRESHAAVSSCIHEV